MLSLSIRRVRPCKELPWYSQVVERGLSPQGAESFIQGRITSAVEMNFVALCRLFSFRLRGNEALASEKKLRHVVVSVSA